MKPKISVLLCFFIFSNGLFGQITSLPKSKNAFIVIAHRGAHNEAPENTLAAFQKAIDLGVDFVEIDLRTSKDNELVIMHDASLERMTGLKIRVTDLSLDSLKLLNVRDLINPKFGDYPIPTFKEVLTLCKNKVNIYLDFKEASVQKAFDEIRAFGMEKNVIVYINSATQLAEWRKVAPNMPLMVSPPKKIKTASEMAEYLIANKIDILDGNYANYNLETIMAAKEMHVPVWADIQSKTEGPDQWNIAISNGILGLQTDHPKELIAFLNKLGLR